MSGRPGGYPDDEFRKKRRRRCFALSERFGRSPLANVTNHVTVRERCYNVSKFTDVRRETAPGGRGGGLVKSLFFTKGEGLVK